MSENKPSVDDFQRGIDKMTELVSQFLRARADQYAAKGHFDHASAVTAAAFFIESGGLFALPPNQKEPA